MTLQLAYHSTKKPHRIMEDVLVKVDKFIFPVDFVVLDFEEDSKCSLILGRPFLNTGKAIIDVHEGTITLRVGEERVEFVINHLMKYPIEDEFFMRLEVMDVCVKKVSCPREAYKKVKESDKDFESEQKHTFAKP